MVQAGATLLGGKVFSENGARVEFPLRWNARSGSKQCERCADERSQEKRMWQRLPVEERALCALVKVTKQALVCLPYLLQCDSSPWRLTRSFINEAGGAAVARRATPRVVICVVAAAGRIARRLWGKNVALCFFVSQAHL